MACTPLQQFLLNSSNSKSITGTGGTSRVDVSKSLHKSLNIVNGATNGVTFTVEVSNDGASWVTGAYREDAVGPYVVAGKVVAGGVTDVLFLSPDDYCRYVRVNVSVANANGTTFEVHQLTVGD